MTATLTPLQLDLGSWLHLLAYFLSLSLLSVGGAMATAPEMYRHTVEQQNWLTPHQFSDSIAIAQAAPGPNIMYVALLGWNMGLNTLAPYTGWTAWLAALAACMVCMLGMLLPSSLLTWHSTRWLHRHHMRRSVKAFRWGMMPLVVGMVLATGWILASRSSGSTNHWLPWGLTAATTVFVWKSRLHLLWLLAAGAAIGALCLQ